MSPRTFRARAGLPLAAVAVTVPMLLVVGLGPADAVTANGTVASRSARLAMQPTGEPDGGPTDRRHGKPDRRHTTGPTADPTSDPSADPTGEPTDDPTDDPTVEPTNEPTNEPTDAPTVEPTVGPTDDPSVEPSDDPSVEPTGQPDTGPTPPAPTASVPPGDGPRRPTTVTLDFDGATVDQYAAGELLASLGMRAVYYVNSGRLDTGGDYLSTGQVRALRDRGHEIGGHGVSPVRLSSLDPVEQRRQVCGDRSRLLAAGLAVSSFAYPFGDNDPSVRAAVSDCGYHNARTLGGLSCRGCDAAESVPPGSPYVTRSVSGINRATTAGELMVAVRRAQATGGWLPIVFQRLCAAAACGVNGIAVAEFESFVRWLDAERRDGAVRIATVHDVLGGDLRPAVAPPAATANRLRITNASFEAAGGAPDVAQCFSISTSGDGTVFAARRVPEGHSGTWAQQIVVAQVRGAVKVHSAQDLGSCAPPVVRQHTYRIGVWYKATAPITVAAYTRRATGGYSSFGTSQTFPATGRWTHAVWTTKGVPATANPALSVGVVFTKAGTYLIDDFSVADAGLATRAEAPGAVETDAGAAGPGPEDLFVPSDTAPAIPPGPAAASLRANQRHGWLLTAQIVGALALMWLVVAALDRRFRQIHRRTRVGTPASR